MLFDEEVRVILLRNLDQNAPVPAPIALKISVSVDFFRKSLFPKFGRLGIDGRGLLRGILSEAES